MPGTSSSERADRKRRVNSEVGTPLYIEVDAWTLQAEICHSWKTAWCSNVTKKVSISSWGENFCRMGTGLPGECPHDQLKQ